jgi:5-dehydro-2-deoxygluconokinase
LRRWIATWRRPGVLERPHHSDDRGPLARPAAGGRARVGCIILGRGEDDQKVRQWLATAASVPGFIGFAVGRTTFWAPLVDYRANKITRATAVERIAAAYREWVGLFEKAK